MDRMMPKYYEQRWYDYQTIARGLLTVDQLTRAFESCSEQYWYSLRSYLPVNKSQLCLDLPCGYGNFLYFLKKHGYQNCRGYDLDRSQVALAQSLGLQAAQADAFIVLANLTETPSLIASIDFVEHLEKSSALRFLEACYERLSPGGTLILRTPCADGPFGAHDVHNDITHQWGLTSNSLRCVLAMVGFSSIQVLDIPGVSPSGGAVQAARWAACKMSRWVAGILLRIMCVGSPSVWGPSMWAVAIK